MNDVEGQPVLFVTTYVVAQAFFNFVIGVECQDDGLDLFDFWLGEIHRIADDDFITFLAGARGGTIQDAAA